MRFAALLIALFIVFWYGGAFRASHQLEHRRGRGPRGAGEWIAFSLGWLAIIAGALFFLSFAFR